MQVFPASDSERIQTSIYGPDGTQQTPVSTSFEDVFNNLKAFDEGNMPGIPAGFRSTRDDTWALKSDDIAELENSLRDQGVDEDTISDVSKQLYASPSAPTVGDAMAVARGESRKTDYLDENEVVVFNSLLQKLGFTNDEIAGIETKALRGKGLDILNAVKGKFTANAPISMTEGEAAVLGKALDLPAKDLAALKKIFGNATEQTLDGKGFAELFRSAEATLQLRRSELAKLQETMPQAVKDMMEQAKIRRRLLQDSDNRSSKRAEYTAFMAKDNLTRDRNKDVDGKTPAARRSLVSELLGKDDDATSTAVVDAEKTASREKHDADQSTKGKHGDLSGWLKQNAAEKLERDSASDMRKHALGSKLDILAGANFAVLQPNPANAAQSAAIPASQLPMYNDTIFDQVQQGILKNAIDGSHQIVMRLDPPEMGKLTLSLTVANGEVKALIRTDKEATTGIIQEQLTQLKASLEEQGLKVSSLDVQTRAQNDMEQQGWTGAEQHNHEQAMQERERMLRLVRTRIQDGEFLAQNVHGESRIHMKAAGLSPAGLHVIA